MCFGVLLEEVSGARPLIMLVAINAVPHQRQLQIGYYLGLLLPTYSQLTRAVGQRAAEERTEGLRQENELGSGLH